MLLLAVARQATAQGGPPMLTDDPGTPGDGILEANFAVTLERADGERQWEAPVVDLNYGVGDAIQLNFESAYAVLQPAVGSALSGAGSMSAAVKWRFVDQKDAGVDTSIYPRVEWNPSTDSARRGLVEDGTRAFLPVEVARDFGAFELAAEGGLRLSSADRSGWAYGVVGGVEPRPGLELMGELHGEALARLDHQRLTANVGLHARLGAQAALIASVGRDLQAEAGASPATIAYLGVQILFFVEYCASAKIPGKPCPE